MARHSVAQPSEWILKMVQAAVLAKAERIVITHGRRATKIRFPLPDTPSIEEFERALFDPKARPTPFLEQLTFGVRALLTRRALRVTFAESVRVWNGSNWQSIEKRVKTSVFQIEVLYPEWWNKDRAREQTEESALLQLRAAYAPIPILLDGRELSVESLPLASPSLDHSPSSPWNLASGYFNSEGILAQARVQKATHFNDPARSGRPLVFWPKPESECAGSFGFFLRQSIDGDFESDQFEIRWTRHGVLAHTYIVSRNAPLGGFLQVSGDHLRTDLTALSLEVDEEDVRQAWSLMKGFHEVSTVTRAALANSESKTIVKDLPGLAAMALVKTAELGVFLLAVLLSGWVPKLVNETEGVSNTTLRDLTSEMTIRMSKLLRETPV